MAFSTQPITEPDGFPSNPDFKYLPKVCNCNVQRNNRVSSECGLMGYRLPRTAIRSCESLYLFYLDH